MELIVSVPDHCLSFYSVSLIENIIETSGFKFKIEISVF